MVPYNNSEVSSTSVSNKNTKAQKHQKISLTTDDNINSKEASKQNNGNPSDNVEISPMIIYITPFMHL